MNKDNLQAKLEKFLGYLRQDPQNIRLHLDVAEIYMQLGQMDVADKLLDQAEAMDQGNPLIRFRRGVVAMATGKAQEALDIFREVLQHGIDNSGLRYNMAYCHVLLSNFEQAEEELSDDYEQLKAEVPAAELLLARVKYHLNQLEEVESLLTSYIREEPDNPEGLGLFALYAVDTMDYKRAKDLATKALAADEHNQEAMLTMGTLALEDADGEAARQYYQSSLKLHGKQGRSCLGMGLVEMLNNNLPEAEEYLSDAVSLMPMHLGTRNVQGWCQITQDKLDEAQKTFEAALEVDRNFSESHGGLAVTQVLLGQDAESEQSIKRALKLDHQCFSAHYAQSLRLAKKGDKEQAENVVQKLLTTPITDNGATLLQSLSRIIK